MVSLPLSFDQRHMRRLECSGFYSTLPVACSGADRDDVYDHVQGPSEVAAGQAKVGRKRVPTSGVGPLGSSKIVNSLRRDDLTGG